MKYLRRAVKYFIQMTVVLVVIIGALMLTGWVSTDISVAFRQGWTSVGYIAAALAAVSAVYPYFGYSRRTVTVPGEPADLREPVLRALDFRGYRLEKEEDGTMAFRLRSGVARVARLWEDRITITPVLGGFELEGLTRDLVRVASSLENTFRNHD